MRAWIALGFLLSHFFHVMGTEDGTFVLMEQTKIASQEAHTKLVNALQKFQDKTLLEIPAQFSDGTDHFSDLMLSIFMDPTDVHLTDGEGQDEKYFAGLNKVQNKGKEFIVYAGGNGSE